MSDTDKCESIVALRQTIAVLKSERASFKLTIADLEHRVAIAEAQFPNEEWRRRYRAKAD